MWLWISCFHFPNTGITGMQHRVWSMSFVYVGWVLFQKNPVLNSIYLFFKVFLRGKGLGLFSKCYLCFGQIVSFLTWSPSWFVTHLILLWTFHWVNIRKQLAWFPFSKKQDIYWLLYFQMCVGLKLLPSSPSQSLQFWLKPGSNIAQTGFEFAIWSKLVSHCTQILLPSAPKYWDYRPESSCPAWIQSLCLKFFRNFARDDFISSLYRKFFEGWGVASGRELA